MKTGWTCRRKEERHALVKQAIYTYKEASRRTGSRLYAISVLIVIYNWYVCTSSLSENHITV
jgi:hypothetical protein